MFNEVYADEPTSDLEKKESVTIRPWQYCEGCKAIVQLYGKLSADELKNMQKSGVKSNSVLEAHTLVKGICDNPYFYNYQPFMKYSCMKIMEEYGIKFLEEFAGQATANDLLNKAEGFSRKRRICVKQVKACDHSEFKRANVTSSKRTRCNACRIIAREIETKKKTLAKNVTLSSVLEDNFCNNLGYNYYPYTWLEDLCDEMVEDKLKDIIGVIDFQAGFRVTGFNPDKVTEDMMCEEFFKCKKPSADDEL